jgi:hypothetical protein
MIRFIVGVLIGAGALAAVAFLWMRGSDACFGRCGDGTKCDNHRCVVAPAGPPVVATKEPKRRRRHGSGEANAPPEIQLKPGDEKMVAQGDALGRAEHLDLSQPDAKELPQEEIDRVIRAADGSIVRCISEAVGDAPLENGRVEVGLRVEKSGSVSRVKVEAPQLMQRNGLTRCIRGVATALRFPASGGASVVTYPFELK